MELQYHARSERAKKTNGENGLRPEEIQMANVADLIDDILRREGGYVNHPADKGGPTNFGITQDTLSRYIGRQALISDVKNLQ